MKDRELEEIYREYLEEDIVKYLSKRKNITLEESLRLYYTSRLADRIHEGRFGLQYLDYKLLAEYLEKELKEKSC